ncbi:MAG TPA: nicotinate-nucleotide--dimethylbenzimidazole phosphoribosyltransferase [Gaiellaceae bacterium]|nr:nicotinate-nucleotide--dimethylbenzimidazole phosphoribosyltransferase [Gaiellaceae bacterium]
MVEIEPLDAAAMAAARVELDRKTKPRRSLGRLEELAEQLAGIGVTEPRFAIVVAAGDHGYAEEGVSAYPAEVTRQMLEVFHSGGAAVCVLARLAGAELVVVDAGVGAGTANATRGPAMSRKQALAALDTGIELARELSRRCTVVALGDMGIANTTAASALHAALLGVPPSAVCGPGTGLDADGVQRKIAVVERALAVNAPLGDPVDVLAALGGFEIALLAGVALGAAAERLAVLLDGFIVAAAALVASRLEPRVVDYMIAAHLSPEPGHRLSLEALGLRPLLDLGLRLGEGTGAALALPLLAASLAVLEEMATFESAQVTDAGR